MPLADWIRTKLRQYNIHSFYYLAHKDNFETILQHGILSLNKVQNLELKFRTFAEEAVQDRRNIKSVEISNRNRYSIHDLVPLYLTPRTPTLYARRNIQSDLFFCVIQSYILSDDNINYVFSDGNAGSQYTRFYYSLNFLNQIDWNVIRAERWADLDDGKRKRNAEFLIHPNVPINRIWSFVVNNVQLKQELEIKLNNDGLDKEITIDQQYFY